MVTVQVEKLIDFVADVFAHAGSSGEEARRIATYLTTANLTGHDSHGVIAIPTYIDRIDKGHIVPGAPFNIVKESATTTVVDGNWGFGFVVAERAMRLTIEKAKKSNVAATTILRQSHVGRVGAYPIMAANEGMIAIMTVSSRP